MIYKLELEAEKVGGRVHFIMGNHEQLNLIGDYRDVHKKYEMIAEQIKVPYKEWLSKRSVIGSWLHNKNCMEKIGENIFVHGGIHPEMIEYGWSGTEINEIFRNAMNSSKTYTKEETLITGKNGPLWYRGMSLQELSQGQVDKIVSAFNVKRVVVGHTVVNPEKISMLYDGRVVNIDLYHAGNLKRGILRGLLITKDGYFEIDDQMNKQILN